MGMFSSIGGVLGLPFGPGGALVGGALGSVGDSLWSRHESRDAASRANNYALYMTSTAHQREVEDLRKAGLNPVLSAMGSGAASMAVPVQPSHNDGFDVESARSNRKQEQLLANQQAEQKRVNDSAIAKNLEEANYAKTSSAREIVQADNLRALSEKALAEAELARVNAARARETMPDIPVSRGLLNEQRRSAWYDAEEKKRRYDYWASMYPSEKAGLMMLTEHGSTPHQIAAAAAQRYPYEVVHELKGGVSTARELARKIAPAYKSVRDKFRAGFLPSIKDYFKRVGPIQPLR